MYLHMGVIYDSIIAVVAVSIFYDFFFFSSRRRHTRCSRDWSSDVCSSDLRADQGADCRPNRWPGAAHGTRRRGVLPRGFWPPRGRPPAKRRERRTNLLEKSRRENSAAFPEHHRRNHHEEAGRAGFARLLPV